MKLIINADDLGYTPVINQAIFDLHNHHRVFSASLLVNMHHSQDAINGLQDCPDLDVGVHLNLTKGRPLSSPGKIPTLLNSAGEFWPTKGFYARAVTGQINRSEVQTELRVQVERLLDFGILPAHLDSHSHWHALPYLRKLIAQLAKDYQIPGIRQTSLRRTLIPSVYWLAAASRKNQSGSELSTPDYILSLHQWMASDGEPVNLFFSKGLHRLISRPNITLELVTHPGALPDPDFPPDTLLAHQRQWEFDLLRHSRFDEWVDWIGAKITSYKAL